MLALLIVALQEIQNMQKDGHNEVKCIFCSRLHTLKDADFEDMLEMCKQKEQQQKQSATPINNST